MTESYDVKYNYEKEDNSWQTFVYTVSLICYDHLAVTDESAPLSVNLSVAWRG